MTHEKNEVIRQEELTFAVKLVWLKSHEKEERQETNLLEASAFIVAIWKAKFR